MTGAADMRCTHCGTIGLEQGFMHTNGTGHGSVPLWISGLKAGRFLRELRNGQRRSGSVISYRCPACSHVEQFVELDAAD